MMYFLLILFFGSLLGITFMIGKKLLMLQNGQILQREEDLFKIQHLEEFKRLTIKNVKKHGYPILVTTIRYYVRSSNLLRNKYQEVKNKIKNIHIKKQKDGSLEKREASNFLKMVSEYKNKIRKIKQKVKEEENL